MSWTLFLQVVILTILVGATVLKWIETARQQLPPKGTRFLPPKSDQ